jgi:tetratricopeptide (TPR) repeat protein
LKRVVICAWDAADWRVLGPLLDRGRLPHLQALVEKGAMGELYQPPPLLQAPSFTSLATGTCPGRHRILTNWEPDPLTASPRAISRSHLSAKPVWEILEDAGYRSSVCNWPVTHPAPKLGGGSVSNLFAPATAAEPRDWALVPGAVYPGESEATLAALRVHPAEIAATDLRYFVPRLHEIDQENDKRLIPLAGALAESVTAHAAATWQLEHAAPDFLAVCYPLIGTASRHYMRYGEGDVFGGVVAAACQLQDRMLGRMVELAGPDALVMVVSAHGFFTGVATPGPQPALGDFWPRPHGILCFAGPGVAPDMLLHGPSALDVVPTILAWLGLPAAEDMPGRVLAEALPEMPLPPRIESWESGIQAPEPDPDPAPMIGELTRLGYADPAAGQLLAETARFHREESLHLACYYLGAGRPSSAIELLEPLARSNDLPQASSYLAWAYLNSNRIDDAAAVEIRSGDRLAGLLHALIEFRRNPAPETLQLLQSREAGETDPAFLCLCGDAYRTSARIVEAESCYERAIGANPELAEAHLGLAQVLLVQGRDREAADSALHATGLRYDLAGAHLALSAALTRLGQVEAARTAYATAAALSRRVS